MSKTLTNVRDILTTLDDDIQSKHAQVYREIEEALEDLDTYNEIFDDEYEARDCKDYYEEMSDIFDDTYEAQRAKDFIEAAEYAGLDDEDLESIAAELEEYRELGTAEDLRDLREGGDTKALEAEIERLEGVIVKLKEQAQRGVELEDQRVRAIAELGGKTFEQAEIDQRAAEEQAYEMGLNDGLIVRKQLNNPGGEVDFELGEQGIVDTGALGIVNDNGDEE
jgi:hypothetical protein